MALLSAFSDRILCSIDKVGDSIYKIKKEVLQIPRFCGRMYAGILGWAVFFDEKTVHPKKSRKEVSP